MKIFKMSRRFLSNEAEVLKLCKIRYFILHDAVHTMMISDIATSAWLIDFCHKGI